MKKSALLLSLGLIVLLSLNAYALDDSLLGARNKIFKATREIQFYLVDSRDIILLNNLWNSCVLTVSQLDAYFSMLGMLENIKQKELDEKTVNYIIEWLKEIKQTNDINIRSFSTVYTSLEAQTKVLEQKIRNYFTDLSVLLDKELEKQAAILSSLKIGRKK